MKGKLILIVSLFALFAISTVWSSGGQEGSAASQAQSQGPAKVVFYLWEDPAFHQLVDTFNAQQKEVVADPQWIPSSDYEAKLTTLLAGGAQMDAYMQKTSLNQFPQYLAGYIEPLDSYIAKYNYDLNAISAYKDQITFQGKVIAIPFRGAKYNIYYNKKVFEQAGVPTPDTYVQKGEWTWDKYMEVAKKIASGDGKVWGSNQYIWGGMQVIPAIQRGKKFITDDGKLDVDSSVLYSFKMRKQMEEDKSIMSMSQIMATRTHYSQVFFAGNCAMLISGDWFPSYLAKGRDDGLLKGFTWNDWAITRLPCNEPTYAIMGEETGSHVHAASKQKDAAFKLISWLGGPEGAKLIAKLGYVPPMINDEIKANMTLIPDAKSLMYYTETVKVYPTFFNKYGAKINAAMVDMMQEYLANNVSDADFNARLKTTLEQIVKTTD